MVEKSREIYFIDSVKFHLDSIQSLGDFIEIESIYQGEAFQLNNNTKSIQEDLARKTEFYISELNLQKPFLDKSYIDLIDVLQ